MWCCGAYPVQEPTVLGPDYITNVVVSKDPHDFASLSRGLLPELKQKAASFVSACLRTRILERVVPVPSSDYRARLLGKGRRCSHLPPHRFHLVHAEWVSHAILRRRRAFLRDTFHLRGHVCEDLRTLVPLERRSNPRERRRRSTLADVFPN